MTKKYKIPKMAVSKIVITFNIIRVFSIKNLKNHKQKGKKDLERPEIYTNCNMLKFCDFMNQAKKIKHKTRGSVG
jgi:hypothetical protein